LGSTLPSTFRPEKEADGSLRKAITSNISPIRELCRLLGYDTLVTELAVIKDQRLLGPDEPPFFVSVMEFGGGSKEVRMDMARCYGEAMDQMDAPGTERTPIVPHPDLNNHAAIFGSIGTATSYSKALPTSVETEKHIAAYRYSYASVHAEGGAIREVEAFYEAFYNELSTLDPTLSQKVEGAEFLVIPITRPRGEGQSDSQIESQNHGYEGFNRRNAGALFLLLQPRDEPDRQRDHSLKTLARRLHLMLVMASLNESFSSHEVTLRERSLFEGLVHGSVNAVRAIRSNNLEMLLSKRDGPPKHPDDLKFRLLKLDEDVVAEEEAELLIKYLRLSGMAENTAVALLSFSEMQLTRGAVREKFQNVRFGKSRIEKVISDSVDLVNNYVDLSRGANQGADRASDPAPIDLNYSAPGDEDWYIPPRFISKSIIKGIIHEILKNASRHGRKDMFGHVNISCKVQWSEGDEELICHFTNEMPKVAGEVSDEWKSTVGFLERSKRALNGIPGLALDFGIVTDAKVFRAELRLGRVHAMTDGGTEEVLPYRG